MYGGCCIEFFRAREAIRMTSMTRCARQVDKAILTEQIDNLFLESALLVTKSKDFTEPRAQREAELQFQIVGPSITALMAGDQRLGNLITTLNSQYEALSEKIKSHAKLLNRLSTFPTKGKHETARYGHRAERIGESRLPAPAGAVAGDQHHWTVPGERGRPRRAQRGCALALAAGRLQVIDLIVVNGCGSCTLGIPFDFPSPFSRGFKCFCMITCPLCHRDDAPL